MMNHREMTMGNDGQTDESNPLDAIIQQVEGYISDPSTVTAETLTELKTNLEDLKSYLEGEETGEPQDMSASMPSGGKPDLAQMIGRGGMK